MKPVSTSPLPPFERAGLPVGLINASPSGEKVMVGAPFNTRWTLCSSANRRPRSSRSAFTSFGTHPRQAAELARMGRQDRPALRLFKRSACVSKAPIPSASITKVHVKLAVELPDEGRRLRRPAEPGSHDDHVLIRCEVPYSLVGRAEVKKPLPPSSTG